MARGSLRSGGRLVLDPRASWPTYRGASLLNIGFCAQAEIDLLLLSLSYLSLYIIAHLTVLPRDDAFLVPHHPAFPHRDYRLSASAYLLIILHGYDVI